MEWIVLLASVLIAAALSGYMMYRHLQPRMIAAQELDAVTIQQNEEIQSKNRILLEENHNLVNQNQSLTNETDKLNIRKQSALEQIENLNHSISVMEQQAQEAADLFYQTKMKTAQESLECSLELEAQKYQENVQSFQTQYNETVAELMKQYKALEGNISILRATNDAAVAAAKRAEEMKDQQAFYRIQLSDADIHEIELLRSVEPYLRDKEPLNKVIWKCYYEKPTTDMIGRVVGSGVKTGIYKITEITTGKCYVGQAANIADRWKQHIKRGVGAETPTRNKLYPAMNAAGPENFTFEIVELCDRTVLDEREDYWQDYFKAKEFGYSIK